LETRTERGFPHFPSNGGYCSLAHLKRQTRQNRGVRQILAQNRNRILSHASLLARRLASALSDPSDHVYLQTTAIPNSGLPKKA